MPVTAKLSRKFYEVFGDEIANELVTWFNDVDATYRSDLRELNELNFARFDAKVEQRFAEQDARLERRFAEQDVKWERRFADQDATWERRFADQDATWEQRFADQDAKWERRISQLEAAVDRRFGEADAKLDQVATTLRAEMRTGFAEQRADLLRWMFVYWGSSVVTTIGLVLLVLRAVT